MKLHCGKVKHYLWQLWICWLNFKFHIWIQSLLYFYYWYIIACTSALSCFVFLSRHRKISLPLFGVVFFYFPLNFMRLGCLKLSFHGFLNGSTTIAFWTCWHRIQWNLWQEDLEILLTFPRMVTFLALMVRHNTTRLPVWFLDASREWGRCKVSVK